MILQNFWGRREQKRATRLDEAEALRLAEAAAGDVLAGRTLVLQRLASEPDRLVWHFWTATIGSGVLVEVDDASGDVRVHSMSGR